MGANIEIIFHLHAIFDKKIDKCHFCTDEERLKSLQVFAVISYKTSFNIALLKAYLMLAIVAQKQHRDEDGGNANDCEDPHRRRVVDVARNGVAFKNGTNEYGNEHQTYVLDVVNHRIGGTQL